MNIECELDQNAAWIVYATFWFEIRSRLKTSQNYSQWFGTPIGHSIYVSKIVLEK